MIKNQINMALFYTTGRISELSEVKSGTGQSGFRWQRMSLTLEIEEYGGFIKKMILQASNDTVDDILMFKVGDKVKVGFSVYAREWKGKWYNNIDCINISAETYDKEEATAPAAKESLNPADNPDDLPF